MTRRRLVLIAAGLLVVSVALHVADALISGATGGTFLRLLPALLLLPVLVHAYRQPEDPVKDARAVRRAVIGLIASAAVAIAAIGILVVTTDSAPEPSQVECEAAQRAYDEGARNRVLTAILRDCADR